MISFRMIKRHLANGLTLSRSLVSVMMIAFPVSTLPFWILYLWGGISDMLDGAVARLTGSASKSGAILDSVSDIVFFMVCLIKFLPYLHLPLWMWVWTGLIALLKITGITIGWMRHHRLLMPHTVWNKITGLLLFALPLLSLKFSLTIPALTTLIIASYAAVNEKKHS